MRDYLPEIMGSIVVILVVILLLFAMIFGVNTYITIHDNKAWNGGHCEVCDGAWEYEQAVGHRSSTTYIYVCGGCGKRIELNEVR